MNLFGCIFCMENPTIRMYEAASERPHCPWPGEAAVLASESLKELRRRTLKAVTMIASLPLFSTS